MHLFENLAEVLEVRKDLIFRTPLFFGYHTGPLDALMPRHNLSKDVTVKRQLGADTHSVLRYDLH